MIRLLLAGLVGYKLGENSADRRDLGAAERHGGASGWIFALLVILAILKWGNVAFAPAPGPIPAKAHSGALAAFSPRPLSSPVRGPQRQP